MTIWSVRSGSTQFRFQTSPLKAAWRRFPERAGRALLRALQDSRMRAAAQVFSDYAHLNSDRRDAARERFSPHQ